MVPKWVCIYRPGSVFTDLVYWVCNTDLLGLYLCLSVKCHYSLRLLTNSIALNKSTCYVIYGKPSKNKKSQCWYIVQISWPTKQTGLVRPPAPLLGHCPNFEIFYFLMASLRQSNHYPFYPICLRKCERDTSLLHMSLGLEYTYFQEEKK